MCLKANDASVKALRTMTKNADSTILQLYFQDKKTEEAFTLLISTYQQKLYWHIRRMLLSHADTDDVLQNTLIKVWKGLPKFKQNSKLYTWLYRIATNESLTFIEKNKNNKSHVDFDNCFNLKSDSSGEDLSGDTIQLKLEKAIAQLPEKQRAVFHLKYYEEMKYDDMSTILETSVGALKASYHHAVKKIEKFILED